MRMDSSHIEDVTSGNEEIWQGLYFWLFPVVQIWVCCSGVISWRSQHTEISEEITQEAVLRAFHYSQRAEQGEVAPVGSLKSLSKVIAHNHFQDRRRKDCRLIHATESTSIYDSVRGKNGLSDPSRIALEKMELSATIVDAAQVVARFPHRQRFALLTDLANVAILNEQPTLFERALSEIGLHLRDYRHPLPEDQAERGRFAALLCIAYKRLRHELEPCD